MPLFGKSKSPAELVKSLKQAISALQGKDKDKDNVKREGKNISKNLRSLKKLVIGENNAKPLPDAALRQLMDKLESINLLPLLINNMRLFNFEDKKRIVLIFKAMLMDQVGTHFPTVEYIRTEPEILFTLITGYEDDYAEIGQYNGEILRACAVNEVLAKIVLYSNEFYTLFRYIDSSAFDIASDSFRTFKQLLRHHKPLCAEFLQISFDKFFMRHYFHLLSSENYVTRRNSVELLGELLFERYNYRVMTLYISRPENLKLLMNMLREESHHIQIEAFHVFKAFVANPKKPKPIFDILLRNQSRLVDFLSNFLSNHFKHCTEFNVEKQYIIELLKGMKPITCV